MNFNISNWTEEEYNKLVEHLVNISDKKYREFHKGLVPGLDSLLGVQVPKLRAIAKEISKGNYLEYLNMAKNNYYEETMIQGLVIGYIKVDYISTLELIKNFLPNINNWAVCDIFCTKFKGIVNYKNKFLNFLKQCIDTDKEFYIRFAVVMLKVMYVEEEYIDEVLYILDNVSHEGYYVKMAVAWTLCDCFIKSEDKTIIYLKNCKLDNFTYNKTLQKIIESNRVNKETKNIIRSMKK